MWSQQSSAGGPRQDPRLRTAFKVAAGGAALSVVGVVMPFVKGTNSYTGLSDTIKGSDHFGVGWWPVVYAAVAVAALFVVQRRSDLSAPALGVVATAFGALNLLYVLYRHNDMTNEIKKVTGGIVTLDDGFGYYVLLLGALGVLAGAGWFTSIARKPQRRPPAPQPPPPVSAYPPPAPTRAGGPQAPSSVYPGSPPPPPA